MTTKEVAARYNELAQTGKWELIVDELYAQDCESIEPETANFTKYTKGLEAIKEKGNAFKSMIEEMHGGYCTEPVVGGNFFSLAMGMDVTMKGAGRINMDEVCVFEVKEGKIIKEQFFF
jgi:hypothetical protein